jgi:phosphatidate cytidylyltransferase
VKNFITRTITGAVYVAVVIGALLLGKTTFGLLYLISTFIGLYEFYRLVSHTGSSPQANTGFFISLLLFLCFFLVGSGLIDSRVFLIFIPLVVLLFISEMYRNKANPFGNIAMTLLGIVYVALPLAMMNFIVFDRSTGNYSPNFMIAVYVLIWSFDSGAYVVGVLTGKHKLFPRLSPKKSWEGLIGGTIFTMFVSWLVTFWFPSGTLPEMLVLGLLIAFAATFGDFAESMLKRSVDIKDSGNLLPGHGGLLDRIDSLLFAVPLVYVWMRLIL